MKIESADMGDKTDFLRLGHIYAKEKQPSCENSKKSKDEKVCEIKGGSQKWV